MQTFHEPSWTRRRWLSSTAGTLLLCGGARARTHPAAADTFLLVIGDPQFEVLGSNGDRNLALAWRELQRLPHAVDRVLVVRDSGAPAALDAERTRVRIEALVDVPVEWTDSAWLRERTRVPLPPLANPSPKALRTTRSLELLDGASGCGYLTLRLSARSSFAGQCCESRALEVQARLW